MVAGLLEGGWNERTWHVGVERIDDCVIAVGSVDGADEWVAGEGVERAFVDHEGAEDVVLD